MNVASAVLLAASLALEAAAPAIAAERFEIAPFLGYRIGGDFQDEVTDSDLEVDESSSFGLAVSRSLDPGRRVEIWYANQSSEISADDGAFTGDPLFDLNVHYLHLGGTVVMDQARALQTFVSGGVGVTHFDPDRGGLDSETRLSLSLGFGGKSYLTRNAGLRIDVRWIGTLMDSDAALFCVDGSCAVRVDGSLFSQWELGAGAFVAF